MLFVAWPCRRPVRFGRAIGPLADYDDLGAPRASPPRGGAGPEVLVRGYNKSNDGGGGYFEWAPESTAPDDDGMVISPGGNSGPGRWLRAPREPGVVSPLYFGARCDGSGDDGAAINKALNYIRGHDTRGDPHGGDLGKSNGILKLPAAQCVLKTSMNTANLGSVTIMIQGTGGSLLCQTVGQPCIDAMGSPRLGFRDITIYGDSKKRSSSRASGWAHNTVGHRGRDVSRSCDHQRLFQPCRLL